MTSADWLMLSITLGIAALFIYSMWSPDWLASRWTPARLVRDSNGVMAVRVFFAVAALGAIALAVVQWMRASESPTLRTQNTSSRMLGISDDELSSQR